MIAEFFPYTIAIETNRAKEAKDDPATLLTRLLKAKLFTARTIEWRRDRPPLKGQN